MDGSLKERKGEGRGGEIKGTYSDSQRVKHQRFVTRP